jgi:aspartate racemase
VTLDPSMLSPGQRYVPGILGGLGPLAHVAFERTVLARSHRRGARADRDHPVWLLASASATPGRTAALLLGAESPVAHLTRYARILEGAGADALFVVCNTAHAFHGDVQPAIGIPWVHLMELAAGSLRAGRSAGTRVGVLATDGTLRARLYHDALERRGLVPVAPPLDSPEQARVRAAIDDPDTGIKATGAAVSPDARRQLAEVAAWCAAQGAEVVILGCTEISVGLGADGGAGVPLLDPLELAADTLLDLAAGRVEPAALYAAG